MQSSRRLVYPPLDVVNQRPLNLFFAGFFRDEFMMIVWLLGWCHHQRFSAAIIDYEWYTPEVCQRRPVYKHENTHPPTTRPYPPADHAIHPPIDPTITDSNSSTTVTKTTRPPPTGTQLPTRPPTDQPVHRRNNPTTTMCHSSSAVAFRLYSVWDSAHPPATPPNAPITHPSSTNEPNTIKE